ncbi:hypothetical protein LTR56_009618 [Elasticomyces elasticus]|nr:hypothetical protein LTR56_009618 [Elasticomyces elasticus]KAK3660118.1 hypothetical protein LTR22_008125 [Elasticomyces elasticus]KAK4923423.1 hypothetical protein LTR49_009297 [Elasticomyces elasticus]KAK5752295.1 hypothetical protein LTS12_017596 [Elasticomyces elasticus]
MVFDTRFHIVRGLEDDPEASIAPIHSWAKDSEVKKSIARFIQTELVEPANSKVLEKVLGSEVRGWHSDFVTEQVDFADSSVKNIKEFLSQGDPAIQQKARIALLLLEIVKAAAVPGAKDAVDQSKKTVKYRLHQAATLLLSVTFDVQTRGYSSHFRKHFERKSIRPFEKVILKGKMLQLKSIVPTATTSQQSTVAQANAQLTLPSQTMSAAVVNSLFTDEFFIPTALDLMSQVLRDRILDYVHVKGVFDNLVSFVKNELRNNQNSALLAERLTRSVSKWHRNVVNDVASFAEKSSTEIECYIQSADAAGAQRCRLAQYVKAILKVAKVPGAKSEIYGNDMLPEEMEYRLRMIVVLLVTIVFDLQSKGPRSYFIKLLEGHGMQPFPSIMHNGRAVQKSTIIREGPTLPPRFLDPLALITQRSRYQEPTARDGQDMKTTEGRGPIKGMDGRWIFREKTPVSDSEQSEGEQSQRMVKASQKKAKAAPKKKADADNWLANSDDDDEGEMSFKPATGKAKVVAPVARKRTAAIPNPTTSTGSKPTEGTTARPVLQARKREMDDTGAKDNGDPKRRRNGGDTIPTAVHKPSYSTKSTAAASVAFGNAGIATDGAVVGKSGDMVPTAPKKPSGSIKLSDAAPGRSGKAGIATDGARKTFGGKSKEPTTGPRFHPEQLKNSGTLFIPK